VEDLSRNRKLVLEFSRLLPMLLLFLIIFIFLDDTNNGDNDISGSEV
jgi:hypothetical protein